jgi:phytoene dehydrogenase-like protein
MTAHRDVVVIGAGVNGLVAAAFLAKRGLKPLVLERSDHVGGCAITSDLAPGYHAPTLAHTVPLDPAVSRSLALERHGLDLLHPPVHACSPTLDGRALVLWTDADRAAASIATFSARDAAEYPRFLAAFARIAGVLRAVASAPPPSIDRPGGRDLLELVKAGRAFRSLGKTDAYRLLRWTPMAVADLVGESFESEPLRAAIAAGGVLGSFLGPRSAGSGAVLLLLAAANGHPIGGVFARGGPGAVAAALTGAARSAGAEIRTTAAVREILVSDGAATGVALDTGETIAARAVVSSTDPALTLLGLVDPIHLPPDFLRRVRHIRMRGALAKVNFALSALPRIGGLSGLDGDQQLAALSGRIRLARDCDTIERAFDAAKYGSFADEPWIELTIPSLLDPALAPDGRHVMSAYVQYAPYTLRSGTWAEERDRLAATVIRTIAQYAPGFESSIVAREVITPLDLEQQYRLTGGHIFQGEMALDQWFVARPLLGWSRYGTPIRRLFLCGSGTHPGAGLAGRPGALAAREIRRAL